LWLAVAAAECLSSVLSAQQIAIFLRSSSRQHVSHLKKAKLIICNNVAVCDGPLFGGCRRGNISIDILW
jgi:hypothetical protein